jgi:hypothetical protein
MIIPAKRQDRKATATAQIRVTIIARNRFIMLFFKVND